MRMKQIAAGDMTIICIRFLTSGIDLTTMARSGNTYDVFLLRDPISIIFDSINVTTDEILN